MTPTEIPDWLRHCFAAAGVVGCWTTVETVEAAPAETGAYALALCLDVPVAVALRRGPLLLPSGWCIYLGSAYGPGGIRARLRRHFRPVKTVHWHVDQLTTAAARTAALAVPGGAECNLVSRLLGSRRFRVAAPGFGNTDCRGCASHLVMPRRSVS